WANIFVQSLGPAGVDSLIGRCGAVDQFFDHYFGTNCRTLGKGKGSIASVSRVRSGGTAIQPPTSAEVPLPKLPALPLPCTVGDLVTSVLGGPVGCGGR